MFIFVFFIFPYLIGMNIGPITNTIINKILEILRKPDVHDKISSNVISPILDDVINKFFPYFALLSSLLSLIIILLIVLIYMLVR